MASSENNSNVTTGENESVVTDIQKAKTVKARAGMGQLPAIVEMAFGDGAVTGSTPRTPLSTDKGLQNETHRQAVTSIELQEDGISVLYRCQLAKATLVGKNINEIGLVDSDGDFACFKSFSNKGKDGDMEMGFSIVDQYG
jgi:phage-related tail fiber protein